MTRNRAILAAPFLAFVAYCSDGPSAPPPVATVAVTSPASSLVAGQTMQLSAVARDASGNPLPDRTITWSSSDAAVASVSVAGLVSAVTPGPVTIVARAESQSGQVTLTVLPIPVATVDVTGAGSPLFVGEARQLTATTRDAAGNVLTGRTVVWSSSDTTRARVSTTGLVTGVAPGVATITATSEGQAGTLGVAVVDDAGAPVIAAISPATLVPGATATISGAGFAPSAGGNLVTIGGVPAPVLSASPTQLAVTVPCISSGTVGVRVTSAGVPGLVFEHPLTVTTRALGVGQAVVLTGYAETRCSELAPANGPARYLIVVFNTATAPNQVADFRLQGDMPAGFADPVPAIVAASASPRRPIPVRDAAWRHDSVHLAHLERERERLQELRARAQQLPASPRMAEPARAQLPDVGDMRDFFFIFGTSCQDTTRVIRGKAIHVGSRSIIWEDEANVLQSSTDPALAGYYQRLGQIFDQEQYQIVRDHFGDPLRRDALTDNDGRIHMVFSQRLNGSGAAAYVTGCDMFPPAVAPASNFGEIFYGFVPTTGGSNLQSTASPDGWFSFMARTVVHEVKHIASLATRLDNNASFEQSWLEEGTARHAEELWVRTHLHRVPWKGNTGFGTAADNGVFCDFNLSDATCLAADALRRPGWGMRRHFNEILNKLVEPWNWSPYGNAGQPGSVFYQTAWSLVRYAIDRFGSSDAAFLSALTEATATGTTNLAAVAGVSMTELVGLWGLALYADNYPGLANASADIRFPTWNLRDIYASLNGDPGWSSRFQWPFPIRPVELPLGAFTTQRDGLRAGAHSYYELSGTMNAPQLLRLQALNGDAVSPDLRIAIARLQ
jgi:hypothetical protein